VFQGSASRDSFAWPLGRSLARISTTEPSRRPSSDSRGRWTRSSTHAPR
jgi:hypothetical protein